MAEKECIVHEEIKDVNIKDFDKIIVTCLIKSINNILQNCTTCKKDQEAFLNEDWSAFDNVE